MSNFKAWLSVVWIVIGFSVSPSVWAHKPSDSYLFVLQQNGGHIELRWDIAIRDLEQAVGVDRNHDGRVTWGELRQQQATINAYALSRLQLSQGKTACELQATDLQTEAHTDGRYAVLWVTADCASASTTDTLSLNYRLLFDIDVTHRGIILDKRNAANSPALIASADHPQVVLTDTVASNAWQSFTDHVREGIHHILIGYDHLLFISLLILPAVLTVRAQQWHAVGTFRPALVNLLKVITAFTAAHSITLSLAVLGVVNLASRWVESAIAFSIIILAVNILYPIVTRDSWKLAFGFGLLHGFGFASVLNGLELTRTSLAQALLGFNVGVELGQLLLVALLFPLVYALRERRFYRTWVLRGAAVLALLIAGNWFIDRAFNTSLS